MTGSYADTLPWYLMPAKIRKERRPALVGKRLAMGNVKLGWTGGIRDEASRRHLPWTIMCSTMRTQSVRGASLGVCRRAVDMRTIYLA
jgi:hypothetical protein